MTFRIGLFLLLFPLYSCGNSSTLETFDTREELNAAIERQRVNDNIPGISMVVGRCDTILFKLNSGFADLSKQVEISDSTDFEWFSITKLFTTAAILNLHEEDSLNLENPVSVYLPFFRPETKSKSDNPVTIKHLLTHTAGLNDKEWRSVTWFQTSDEFENISSEKFAKNIFNDYKKLNREPGQEHQYSNLGFVLLGEVVREVSGQPVDQYVTENITKPLNLSTTYYENPGIVTQNPATGYESAPSLMAFVYRFLSWRKGVGIDKEQGYIKIEPLYPPHFGYLGLRGSANDLAVFASQFSCDAVIRGIIIESSISLMKQKHIPISETRWMGMGWQILQDFHGEFIRHLGGGPGYKSEVRVYEDGTYIVVLGNTTFDIWNYSNLLIYNFDLLNQ